MSLSDHSLRQIDEAYLAPAEDEPVQAVLDSDLCEKIGGQLVRKTERKKMPASRVVDDHGVSS